MKKRLVRVISVFAMFTVLGIALSGTHAIAAPAAPFNAFTLDGANGSWLLGTGSILLDDANATVTASGGLTGVQLNAATPTNSHWWFALLAPPTGDTFTAGTTYQGLRLADATHGRLDVEGDGRGCNMVTGTFTVEEISVDAGGQLTALAVSYTDSCEGFMPAVSGELRWHSTVGYVAGATDPTSKDFGTRTIGVGAPATTTVTVTSTGSAPLALGAASITGPGAAAFGIGANQCAQAVLQSGEACTIDVTADPTVAGTQTGTLTIADNSASGHRAVPLTVVANQPVVGFHLSTSAVNFGSIPVGTTTTPNPITVSVTGDVPVTIGTVTLGGATPAAFGITTETCSQHTLSPGQQCSISVVAHPTATGSVAAALVINDNTGSGPHQVTLGVTGVSTIGTYYPVSPTRLLDTRSGLGAAKAPVGPKGVVHLQVTGRGGVPASGVSAVVLNVSVTGPTTSSFVTAYPTGTPRPTASNLNFATGWTGANSVTVALGTGGKVDLYNNAGSTHVIADVVGFYGGSNSLISTRGLGGQYQPLQPQRLLDTRDPGIGPLPAAIGAVLAVDFGSVNTHIRALAVNVAVVNPGAAGYLTTWNGQGAAPGTSTLNFAAHATVPNLAIVPVSTCTFDWCSGLPMIGIVNHSKASTHLVVDLFGFFDDSTLGGGLVFHPMTPTRIADSRTGLGMPRQRLGPGAITAITSPQGVADPSTFALALNVAAVNPTTSTHISVWPATVPALPVPTVSNLNPAKGQTVPNAVLAAIGPPLEAFMVLNANGFVDIVVDVDGTFVDPSAPPTGAALRAGDGRAVAGPSVRPLRVTRTQLVQIRSFPG